MGISGDITLSQHPQRDFPQQHINAFFLFATSQHHFLYFSIVLMASYSDDGLDLVAQAVAAAASPNAGDEDPLFLPSAPASSSAGHAAASTPLSAPASSSLPASPTPASLRGRQRPTTGDAQGGIRRRSRTTGRARDRSASPRRAPANRRQRDAVSSVVVSPPAVPATPASATPPSGLDAHGNPAKPDIRMTAAEKECWVSIPRNAPAVDWAHEQSGNPRLRELRTGNHHRATYGQRFGRAVADSERCQRCTGEGNPFASCKVAVTHKGLLLFGGACMNCGWSQQASTCKHRTAGFPASVWQYLADAKRKVKPQRTPSAVAAGSPVPVTPTPSLPAAPAAPSVLPKAPTAPVAPPVVLTAPATPSRAARSPSAEHSVSDRPTRFDSVMNAVGEQLLAQRLGGPDDIGTAQLGMVQEGISELERIRERVEWEIREMTAVVDQVSKAWDHSAASPRSPDPP